MELPEGGSQVEGEGGQGAGREPVGHSEHLSSRCSGLPCVLGPPLVAKMVVSHHPQAHLLLRRACQKELPLENFVAALLLSGA